MSCLGAGAAALTGFIRARPSAVAPMSAPRGDDGGSGGGSMAKIRFGVVGVGVNGNRHLEEIATIPDAALVAVCDVDATRAGVAARRWGVAAHSDPAELLARRDVDVVAICTPTGLHADLAVQAAQAGKHAIVESPMEVTLEAADAMIAAFHRADRHLGVVSQHRFDPATVRLKALLDAGEFGDVLLAQATGHAYRSQSYYDRGGWRGSRALDGGGAAMNQSFHLIDVLQYLVGPVRSVQAVTDRLGHTGLDVEDVALATWRLASGGLAQVSCTTTAHPGFPPRIALFGSQATAILEDDRLTDLYRRGTDEASPGERGTVNQVGQETQAAARPQPGASHRLQLRDMVRAIQEDRPPTVAGEDGRKAIELVLAIYRAAELGTVIALPLG